MWALKGPFNESAFLYNRNQRKCIQITPAVIVCHVRHPCTYGGTPTGQTPTRSSATELAAFVLRHFALQVPCQYTALANLHPLIFGLTSFGQLLCTGLIPTHCFISYDNTIFTTIGVRSVSNTTISKQMFNIG